MRIKSKIFTAITLISILLFLCISSFSQHEVQIPLYGLALDIEMDNFKNNAYNDERRFKTINDVEILKEGLSKYINRTYEPGSHQYKMGLSLITEISSFYYYILGFSDLLTRGVSKEDFDRINKELEIVPRNLGVNCDYVSFYEIEIGEFRAVFAYNHLKPSDFSDFKTIQIDYKTKDKYGFIRESMINVAGNYARCIDYKSNNRNTYYPIISVSCTLLENPVKR